MNLNNGAGATDGNTRAGAADGNTGAGAAGGNNGGGAAVETMKVVQQMATVELENFVKRWNRQQLMENNGSGAAGGNDAGGAADGNNGGGEADASDVSDDSVGIEVDWEMTARLRAVLDKPASAIEIESRSKPVADTGTGVADGNTGAGASSGNNGGGVSGSSARGKIGGKPTPLGSVRAQIHGLCKGVCALTTPGIAFKVLDSIPISTTDPWAGGIDNSQSAWARGLCEDCNQNFRRESIFCGAESWPTKEEEKRIAACGQREDLRPVPKIRRTKEKIKELEG